MRRYCRKASANVRLFFELQNFFHFFFKKSAKNLVFSIQTLPKAGRTGAEEPDCQQRHTVHLTLICTAKDSTNERKFTQISKTNSFIFQRAPLSQGHYNKKTAWVAQGHPCIYSAKRHALFVAGLLNLYLDCINSAKQCILKSIAHL